MKKSRVEFSETTKRTLADRVAWRCCFPDCPIITIGPGNESDTSVIKLGEAAHIFAASPGGPRPNNTITKEEKSSIQNGIWMCRQHARLIDADHIKYSAETLKQWKKIKELETYKLLQSLVPLVESEPTTLVSLGPNILFEGIWKSIHNNDWTFIVRSFIIGDITILREFSAPSEKSAFHYIIVESQGDGRLLAKNFSLQNQNGQYEITVTVSDKEPRQSPLNLGSDMADDEDGDILIEDGDLKLISGVDLAKQLVRRTLSISVGEFPFAPLSGSYSSEYYGKFRNDPVLLSRTLKVELIRLVSIPEYDEYMNLSSTALNFVNRIIEVKVKNTELIENRLTISIKLEWGDASIWEDDIRIFISPRYNSSV